MKQESVWDYPRPPRLEPFKGQIRVVAGGIEVVRTVKALRLLETSHPPAYYLPPEDVAMKYLRANPRQTFCEFKGVASYLDLILPEQPVRKATAWCYLDPTPQYRELRGYLAFYPSRVDECWVDDERVVPQEGDFYGGWLTSNLVGPFKGGPGTMGW